MTRTNHKIVPLRDVEAWTKRPDQRPGQFTRLQRGAFRLFEDPTVAKLHDGRSYMRTDLGPDGLAIAFHLIGSRHYCATIPTGASSVDIRLQRAAIANVTAHED